MNPIFNLKSVAVAATAIILPLVAICQQNKVETTYYPGTQTKKTEYEYAVGKKATVGNIVYRDDKSKLVTGVDVNNHSVEERVPNGYWNEYYQNGKPQVQYHYVNGARDGEAKQFFENGSVDKKYNYKNDVISGDLFEYYDNGTLQIKSTYVDGVRVGSAVVQDLNGNAIMYLTYSVPEERHGHSKLIAGEEAKIAKVLAQIKHANGNVAQEGYLESYYSIKGFQFYYDPNFRREGIWVEYDPTGLKLNETSYHESYQVGLKTTFYATGKKNEETTYKANTYLGQTLAVADGPYHSYYENGQLAKSGTMKTLVTKSKTAVGELETQAYNCGDWRRYDDTGKLIEFLAMGRGDEVICELNAVQIADQTSISDQLNLDLYKSRAVEKFTKYQRFHFGDLLDRFDNLDSPEKPMFDEIRSQAMTVYNEYVEALKNCSDKSCVKTSAEKLTNVFVKLQELLATGSFIRMNTSVRQYGIKQALKI